ncbi:MAG TPA: PIN domain-containing protein [Gemmatimonadales bacterium]|nr:PIN domain-containing protein [Gemmatimonadales bacterium]
MILIDTPIWSLALRRRSRDLNTGEKRHVREWERLVRAGTAHLIGPIRQELLSGVRDDRAWDRLRAALRPFPDLPVTTDDYERAAQFFNRCRSRGIVGSAIDLLICAVSAGYGAPIYTTDADFPRYSAVLKLKLHAPKTKPKD